MIRRPPTPGGPRLPGTFPKVMIIRIADAARLQSNSSTSWSYLELDLPEIEDLGPYIESIVVHTNTVGATANHAWKLVTWWTLDDRNFIGPTDVFAPIVAGSGPAIQPAFTTASAFGLRMRYALAVRNNTGTAPETAAVDAWLQITFKS